MKVTVDVELGRIFGRARFPTTTYGYCITLKQRSTFWRVES